MSKIKELTAEAKAVLAKINAVEASRDEVFSNYLKKEKIMDEVKVSRVKGQDSDSRLRAITVHGKDLKVSLGRGVDEDIAVAELWTVAAKENIAPFPIGTDGRMSKEIPKGTPALRLY